MKSSCMHASHSIAVHILSNVYVCRIGGALHTYSVLNMMVMGPRYGYTEDDIAKLADIDSRLAVIEQERAAYLRAGMGQDMERDAAELLPPPSPEKIVLPAIGKGKSNPPPPPKHSERDRVQVPDYLQEQVSDIDHNFRIIYMSIFLWRN